MLLHLLQGLGHSLRHFGEAFLQGKVTLLRLGEPGKDQPHDIRDVHLKIKIIHLVQVDVALALHVLHMQPDPVIDLVCREIVRLGFARHEVPVVLHKPARCGADLVELAVGAHKTKIR